ncbi:hypothetical protein BVI1335_1520003 [Burkholderia vietnamiensis]|nr:hypothetical protein BVI1335_1520003 [Burkholderia vietnamiensis]
MPACGIRSYPPVIAMQRRLGGGALARTTIHFYYHGLLLQEAWVRCGCGSNVCVRVAKQGRRQLCWFRASACPSRKRRYYLLAQIIPDMGSQGLT